jgi:hypothetical protein
LHIRNRKYLHGGRSLIGISRNYTCREIASKEIIISLKNIISNKPYCPNIEDTCLDYFIELIVKNRLETLFKEYFERNNCRGRLYEELNKYYGKTHIGFKKQLEILRRVLNLFFKNNIEYVIIKTINPSKSIGVDIDVLINKQDYWRVLKLLIDNGFKLIDDPRKIYEVGLIYGSNPIILDLHTDLAVGGVSYLDPEIVLLNKRITDYYGLELYVPDPGVDSLIRSLHSVVKEGVLFLRDMYDIIVLENSVNRDKSPSYLEGVSDQCIKIHNTIVWFSENMFGVGKSISGKHVDQYLLQVLYNGLNNIVDSGIRIPINYRLSKIIGLNGFIGLVKFTKNILLSKRSLYHLINKIFMSG